MKKISVFSGLYWITIAAFISKFVGFAAQIVLGWLLSKEDFGLFAIILSLSAAVSFLRNGGSQDVLIQRGKEFDNVAPAVLMFSLVFNVVASLILLVIAYFASNYYSEPLIIYGLALISLSIILTTPAPVLVAKLSIKGYFDKLAIVTMVSNIVRHGLTVVLALLGFGVFSFILPIAIEPIVMFVLLILFAKYIPKLVSNVNVTLYKEIFSASKWVILSNLSLALIMNGQYFFISLYQERNQLGVYFFAMQLIVSICLIVSQPVNQVFYPRLCDKSGDHAVHSDASYRALVGTMGISAIVGLILYVLAEYLISFLWAGKWDESIKCVQWLAFSIPASLVMTLCFSICASIGVWKTRFYLLSMCAIVDICMVVTAAFLGNPETIALCLAIGRLVSAFVLITITLDMLKLEKIFDCKIKIMLMVPICLVFFTAYLSEVSSMQLNRHILFSTILIVLIYYAYLIRGELFKLLYLDKFRS